MKKIITIASTAFLFGCTTNAMYDPNPPRLEVRAVPYESGMRLNTKQTHIDSHGNITSMYDPIVHCHTLTYPGKPTEKICRIVK